MNELVIAGIYDKKGGHFLNVQAYPDYTTAVRSWQLAVEKTETFQKWPEDFELRTLCSIDNETGVVNEYEKQPIPATAFIKQNEEKHNTPTARK